MAVAIGVLGCIMAVAIGVTWAVEGVGSVEFGLEGWVAIEAYLAVAATLCYTSWEKESVLGYTKRRCKRGGSEKDGWH